MSLLTSWPWLLSDNQYLQYVWSRTTLTVWGFYLMINIKYINFKCLLSTWLMILLAYVFTRFGRFLPKTVLKWKELDLGVPSTPPLDPPMVRSLELKPDNWRNNTYSAIMRSQTRRNLQFECENHCLCFKTKIPPLLTLFLIYNETFQDRVNVNETGILMHCKCCLNWMFAKWLEPNLLCRYQWWLFILNQHI